ncbi:MAG: hypothetical protein NW207_01090 [Cytophagales bacterium]|nr:hypothetical protein [Cytophagales bacterium]
MKYSKFKLTSTLFTILILFGFTIMAQPPSCNQCEDQAYLISTYGCTAPCDPGQLPANDPGSWDVAYASCSDAECNNIPVNQDIILLVGGAFFIFGVSVFISHRKHIKSASVSS